MTPHSTRSSRPATSSGPPEHRAAAAGRIVVGVDDGPTSVAALAWALRTAKRQQWGLDVVTAWPDREDVFVRDVPGHHSVYRHRAVLAQRRALARVVDHAGPVPPIRTFVENARPADALAEHGSGAELLVVGESRSGAARSTAMRVSGRSDCPVVVVAPTRSEETPPVRG